MQPGGACSSGLLLLHLLRMTSDGHEGAKLCRAENSFQGHGKHACRTATLIACSMRMHAHALALHKAALQHDALKHVIQLEEECGQDYSFCKEMSVSAMRISLLIHSLLCRDIRFYHHAKIMLLRQTLMSSVHIHSIAQA